MKGKIAILTQPLGHNYGGILQNFALQKVLKNLGYKSVTFDIRKNYNYFGNINKLSKKRKLYNFLLNETKHRLEGRRKILPIPYYFRYIHANTANFINKYIKKTNVIHDTDTLKKVFYEDNYTSVIVGSDQVWRPLYSPNIYNFFLDFINDDPSINKFSYAASFGTAQWEYSDVQYRHCKNLINNFDNISVREFGGVSLCKDYFGVHAELVLDPTMLLKADDYLKLIKNTKKIRKGIFCYVLDKSEKKNIIISKISKLLNLNIFYNQPQEYYRVNKNLSAENYKIPKVEDWIKSFYEADFIITDSFHGTVFSILFKKDFAVILNEDRGSDRFSTLLKQLDLEDRIISDKNLVENILKTKIDYELVDNKLDVLRDKSLLFLKSSLNQKQ